MHLRGIAYALVASLLFGLGAVLAQLLGKEIDAIVVAVLSLGIGGLLITLGLMFTRTPAFKALQAFKRRNWIDLFLLSILGTALPLILIVAGFARTSALEGGFILQFNSVAALIFAVLLLRERIHVKQSAGIMLLLLGGALVVLKGTQGITWSSNGLGDVLILVGAIGLGFGFIPAKRLSEHIDALPLTAMRLLLGACSLLPLLALQILIGGTSLQWHPSVTTLWIILPLYIVSNFCCAYIAQQAGFHLLKAWEVAAIMQTIPLFSTISALLLLHDSLTLIQAVGAGLAILGGTVVSLSNEGTNT